MPVWEGTCNSWNWHLEKSIVNLLPNRFFLFLNGFQRHKYPVTYMSLMASELEPSICNLFFIWFMTALGDRTHWYILNIDFNSYHTLNPFLKKTTLTTNKRYAISISQSGIHLFSWNESRIIDQVALSIIRSSIHIPKWNVFRNFTLLSFLYLLSK